MTVQNGFATMPEATTFGQVVTLQKTDADGKEYRRGPKIKVMREEYAQLPALAQVRQQIQSIEANLGRVSKEVEIGHLWMNPATGFVKGNKPGANPIPMLQPALASLVGFIESEHKPSHAAAYISTIGDLQWRAREFNRLVQLCKQKPVQLHIWRRDGEPAIYAVTGPKYTPFSPSMLLDVICQDTSALQLKCQGKYSPLGISMKLFSDLEKAAEELGAGEAFRAALALRSAEDGSMSIQKWLEVMRSLCRNLSLLGYDRGGRRGRRHIGEPKDIARDVGHFASNAAGGNGNMKEFLDLYREATGKNIPGELQDHFVDAMCGVGGTKRNAAVQSAAIPPTMMANAIKLAAKKEKAGLETVAGVFNGVTRAAHEGVWPNDQVADDLQAQAPALIYRAHEVDVIFARARSLAEKEEKDRLKRLEDEKAEEANAGKPETPVLDSILAN